MTQLTLGSLWRDATALFARFGVSLYLDFLAFGIAVTTFQALFAPQAFRGQSAARADAELLDILLDPAILLHEAGFSVIFGLACLRVWREMGQTSALTPAGLRMAILPLIVLNVATGYAAYLGTLLFFAPGLIVLALTTVLVPVIMIEGLGWASLGRAMRMASAHIPRLALVWGILIIPFLIVTVNLSPTLEQEAGPMGALWVQWMVTDAVTAALSTFSLCVVIAAYQHLTDQETGGRDLPDIFR